MTWMGAWCALCTEKEIDVTYWRMQMHPGEPGDAVKHTVESLSSGYIGLDFSEDMPDLHTISKTELPKSQKNYWAFAHEMKLGDRVILFAHHHPFALVHVSGEYNYIRYRTPELGLWFRHFRAINDVRYYADFETDVRKWPKIVMTATITPLRSKTSESYRLIDRWLGKQES
jgi:hypothetical protein